MNVIIVNMIPLSMSGETNQDSEPNLAVNPANPQDLVATAFTPAPLGGSFAPVYVSTDGGITWSLNTIVPGNGSAGTDDITVAFGTSGGVLYAGILNGTTVDLNILRTAAFTASTPMTVLENRASEDQPWTIAITAAVGGGSQDRVYVGNNDFKQPKGATATVDLSTDAATAAPPAGFIPHGIEQRTTEGQDGPPVRLAAHSDGTIYAAFERWASFADPDLTFDVVVTRDDSWGSAAAPFGALVDSGDHMIGQRVATNRFAKWNDTMGQERIGADLTIAVDPANSSNVWLAWCDRVGGASGTDWTLHVTHSTDRGQTWSADVRTITNAKNPGLAVNSYGRLGLLYQQFTGTNWVASLEFTLDAWATAATTVTLHTASASTPTATFQPYIGDYVRLLAVGTDFYGVFCGNNTPAIANFPNGVIYQRNADWATQTLLSTDNVTPVAVSIDPFFFYCSVVSLDSVLAFIKTNNTPNGHVEVHIASGASNYQTRILETATTFANESDGVWQLLPNEDLAFIKTNNTPNGHVEVHIASRASNYQTRILETATTFANESDGVWQLLPNEDLAFIKTNNTPNGHVEVHIASRASNYQTRILETATTFANESDGVWQLLPNEDLAFIKTNNTPNGHVEVHIASRASNYQTRILETATTFANESDGVWQLLPNEDLAFIKTNNTPNGHVEVHIASRASNYQTRILETATTFANESDGVWQIFVPD